MKLNYRIFSVLFLMGTLLFSTQGISQETVPKPKSNFWKKVRFGGGLGLNFGSNSTNVTIAPSALYQPNEYIAFGPGLNYSFQRFGDSRTTLIGGSAILLAQPINFLQLSSELEITNVNQRIDGGIDREPFTNTALFLGAGYRLNIGGNTLGAAGIRYNVLFNENSENNIFAMAWQPFVRFYF